MGATIKDIAKETGLGLATISSYINGGNVREKNRIKIEKAIQDLHFEVNEMARGLKTNRTKMIGILIPELNNVFCAEIITEVEDVLRSKGYATMICDCRTDEKREEEAVEFLFHRRVDGLIVIPTASNGNHLQKFIDSGKPVVVIDRKIEQLQCDTVLVDNRNAVSKAVQRLIQAGHDKIAIITGPDHVYTAKERFAGYKEAIESSGYEVKKERVAHGDYTIQGGAKAMRKLLETKEEMTAVIVSNYEMTVGAMMELNEAGMEIPTRVSLVGYDNVEFAKTCTPQLDIVTQPTKELGSKAAQLMLKRLAEEHAKGEAKQIVLHSSYVEGMSVMQRNQI